MDNSIILHNLTREELFSEISKIVSQAIDTKLKPEAPQEYKTKKEVSVLFRCSLPTVSRMVADGTIKGYRFNRRILFKSDEISQALKEIHTLKYKKG